MGPKKGKKGKKGKKSGKKGGSAKTPATPASAGTGLGDDPFIDKEELLQNELDGLNVSLQECKGSVEELRKENDWLQQEAHKIRVESHEYMSYMEKKTSKRQTTIISLSDSNQKSIQDLLKEKDVMLQNFEEKKSELRTQILEKESKLQKARDELNDLQEFKVLQKEQQTKIKDLEKELMVTRGLHSETIQQLKSTFLTEKRYHEQESEDKIQVMAKQANKEALLCLDDHTDRIKQENRKLRRELLHLIQQTRALHDHRHNLEEQHRQLLAEQQYARDLRKLRSTRQHKVLKSFGLIDGEGNEIEQES